MPKALSSTFTTQEQPLSPCVIIAPLTLPPKHNTPALGWCRSAEVQVNGKRFKGRPNAEGYLAIERVWKKADQIALQFKLEPRLVIGDHGNRDKVTALYGPLVLAADEA